MLHQAVGTLLPQLLSALHPCPHPLALLQDAAAEALQAWVPAEQLPVAYGGTCTVLLGESELEQEMAAYVAQLNAAAGVGSPSRVAGLESSSSARGAAAAVQSASSGGKAAADAGAVQPAAGQR